MGAETDQPRRLQRLHLLPVQGLGQRLLRAAVGKAAEHMRRQRLEALQVMGQRQAAAFFPVGDVVGAGQRPADFLQVFEQTRARLFAVTAPQGFAKAFPPEALATADKVGGQENARRYLVLLQQGKCVDGVVTPTVVEGQGDLGPRTAMAQAVALEQVHQGHAIEVLLEPAQQLLEGLGTNAQFVTVR
ncbi:hypothetical protein D3C85_1205520 [compost metagenome]